MTQPAPPDWVTVLPTVNALLNLTATVLLVTGYVCIKRGKEQAHKQCMLAAFAVSAVFLVSYLIYHQQAGHVRFTGPPAVRTAYLAILFSHIGLAVTVPILAIGSIYLGLRDRRDAHRRWGKWAFPIWLYVSVTGVVVYVMLYVLYPPGRESLTISVPAELPAVTQTLVE